ncbi:recombinase family protein [Pacificimonas sp. ICDLI1SI03]
MTRAALYLRVSTDRQTVENQRRDLHKLADLKGWTITQTYTDEALSGAKGRDKRPGLEALMKDAARRKFDIAVFWSVDRLGRSTSQVATAMAELDAHGIAQFYHSQAIDTSTPHGRAMLQMAAVFAELERAMIVERVKAGLARAKAEPDHIRRAKGKRPIGRPSLPKAKATEIVQLRSAGHSLRATAKASGVSLSTVQKVLATA